jgi:nucleoid-associated protein YgaU
MLKKITRAILISTAALFLMAGMTAAQQATSPTSSEDVLEELEKLQLELGEIKTMLESKKVAIQAREDLAKFKEEILVKLGLWRGRLARGMMMAIEAKKVASKARKETITLLERVKELEKELAKKPEVKLVPKNVYRVEKGDSLWRISSYRNIYNDPSKWPKIYQANIDKIKDPNLIYIGQRLFIPPKTQHRVLKGENLFEIANYESIYNEPWEWRKIFEANRDKIKNPNLIYPGQLLVIPQG